MTDPATDTEVAEITERLAKATPGPWECGPTPRYLGYQQFADGSARRVDPVTIRSPLHHTEEIATVWTYLLPTEANASLITEAVNLLPALLSRIAAQDAARVADGVRIAELEADCAQFDARALADNANLRADLAAALEALRPFAEAEIDIDYLDEELWVSFERITYGDLRRARALAAKPDGGTNE